MPLRILTIGNMYPPHHLGGYEVMWRAVVGTLRERGHQVRVLTTDYRLDGAGPELESDVHRRLRWYWRDHAFPRMGPAATVALERANQATLRAQLESFAPEAVVWGAMGGMSLSLIESVRREGPPAIGIVCDDWMVYGPRVDGWMRFLARPGVPAAAAGRLAGVPGRVELGFGAHWAFISEATRSAALAERELESTSVIHAGVDLSLFAGRPPHAWSGDLLCVGRLDERKGLATAIRALALLDRETTLTIDGRGDPRERARLDELADELAIGDRVRFQCSQRSELPAVYAAADAVLFPVVWGEPWGLVPLEAMAVGTPVVATGLGGSAEYLRHGANCLVFEPSNDPAALAGAVRRLATEAELRVALRDGGAKTAARHDLDRFTRGIAELLEARAGAAPRSAVLPGAIASAS